MANTIQIGADTSGFVSGINRAQSSMAGLGSMIQRVVGGAAVFSALTAAAKGFYSAMEAGGALVDLSGQTGVAIDKLMVLQMAFDQAGMSAGDVQPVLAKLQKNIAEAASGSVEAAAKFARMGIEIGDIQGLSADEQLAKVGEAISRIENPAQRSAMAMEIFGKSGAKLLSVFSSGGLEDIQANLGNQANLMLQNAGIFDRATDVLGTAGSKIQGLFVGVASEVMPQIMGVINALNEIDLSPIGQAFGNAISFWINYFQNFGATGDLIYNTLKLAFANGINFFAEEMAVTIATAAARMKALLTGGDGDKAAQEAQIKARARGPIIDTTAMEANVEAATAAIEASKQATAEKARQENPTLPPGESGAGFLLKAVTTAGAAIGMPDISSLQKVGGGSGVLGGGEDNSPAYQSVRIQEEMLDYIKDLVQAVKQGGQSYQISPNTSSGMVLTA